MAGISNARKGDIIISFEILLWSFFPILTIISLNSLNFAYSLAFTFLIASVFFLAIIAYGKKWSDFLHMPSMKYVLGATFFIGLYYALVFYGLQFTTAGNSSIILLMEVFFSFLILGMLLGKERITSNGGVGALLMVLGAIIVLFRGGFHFNAGDIIILAATAFPPFGNYLMQKARKNVSSVTIMFIRSLVTSAFMLLIGLLFFDFPGSSELRASMPFLMISGILLFGLSKILWMEAIHRIPITRAVSLSTISPAFTLVFAFFILKEIPTAFQIAGLVPLVAGALLILRESAEEMPT